MSKTENFSAHPDFNEDVPLKDPRFRKYALGIASQLPKDMELFSEMTKNGIHVMGARFKGMESRSAPTLVQIPGLCHKNTAFRKTWLPHAQDGIQTIALTPPGTFPSVDIPHPISKWGIADYLEPIQEATEEIARERNFLVMEGHSLGGLLALMAAAWTDEISNARKNIRAWIGINSIKPPNIAQRLQPFELPDRSDELSFANHPEYFLDWVNGLFDVITEEKIELKYTLAQMGDDCACLKNGDSGRSAALGARQAKLPSDFSWIIEDRKSCRGPKGIVNDYGYGIWAIDRRDVRVHLLDINGAWDREDISGVALATKTDKIREPAQMFADNSNIRRCIAKYYALGDIQFTENERPLEETGGIPSKIQEAKPIWGVQAILREGTHNSPIELERHVELTRGIIRDFVKKVMDPPRSVDNFTLFYV